MNLEELNNILSAEPEIIPSSGFTQSVMQAVREEAQVPKPIPVPWRRALPGIFACCLALFVVVELLLAKPVVSFSLPIPTMMATWHAGLDWLTLAMTISTAALLLTKRLIAK